MEGVGGGRGGPQPSAHQDSTAQPPPAPPRPAHRPCLPLKTNGAHPALCCDLLTCSAVPARCMAISDDAITEPCTQHGTTQHSTSGDAGASSTAQRQDRAPSLVQNTAEGALNPPTQCLACEKPSMTWRSVALQGTHSPRQAAGSTNPYRPCSPYTPPPCRLACEKPARPSMGPSLWIASATKAVDADSMASS